MIAKIFATCEYRIDENDLSKPQRVSVEMTFETEEAAREFAAQLPKNLGARAGKLYAKDDVKGFLSIHANLLPTKGNDRNETGIKRYHAAVRKLAALGVTFEWSTPYSNSYPTRESFETAIA